MTKKLRIHGYRKNPNLADHMYVYGSDEPKILDLIKQQPELGEKLSPKYGYTYAEVLWAVREEMAMTVEDVLSRRVRLLLRRCPRSHRGGAEGSRDDGQRTGTRPGLGRYTGKGFHGFGENVYL